MNIEIDGISDIIRPESDTDTLGSILEGIRLFIFENNRTVAVIHVDGKLLNAELESEWQSRPVSDFKLLEVLTCSKLPFSTMNMDDLTAVLPIIHDEFNELSKLINESRNASAINQICLLIDALKNARDVIIRSMITPEKPEDTPILAQKTDPTSFSNQFNTYYKELNRLLNG